MEILKFTGWGLVGIASIVFFLFLCLTIYNFLARRVIPTQYEWLDVLSHNEWKTTLQMSEEMKKKKGTFVGNILVYDDSFDLEEEELVECREIGGRFMFRLTPAGTREKNNRQLAREIDSCSSTA